MPRSGSRIETERFKGGFTHYTLGAAALNIDDDITDVTIAIV